MGYFFVAASGMFTVASFLTPLENLLLDYSSILSLAIFLLQIIFVNFSHSFGLTLQTNFYTAMLVYVSEACHGIILLDHL